MASGIAGHPVLSSPFGTDACVASSVRSSLDRASHLLRCLHRLLISRRGTTVDSPDEFDLLLRFCIWSRPRHFMRTLPPGPVTTLLTAFQASVVAVHLESIPSSVLDSALHIDWLPTTRNGALSRAADRGGSRVDWLLHRQPMPCLIPATKCLPPPNRAYSWMGPPCREVAVTLHASGMSCNGRC